MPFGFHGLDLIVILVIALLIFGPKKLPEMGASIGKSIKEFQKGMKEVTGHKDDDDDDDDELPVSSKDMKKLKTKTTYSEPAPKSSVSDLSGASEPASPELPIEVAHVTETTEVHAE